MSGLSVGLPLIPGFRPGEGDPRPGRSLLKTHFRTVRIGGRRLIFPARA